MPGPNLALRVVTPEPLSVSPALIGAPLASPGRRAAAMALDLLAIALLTGVGGLWLVAAAAVLVLQLASRRGGVPRSRAMGFGWAAAALVLWLAASEVQQRWQRAGDDGPAVAVADAADAADGDSAVGGDDRDDGDAAAAAVAAARAAASAAAGALLSASAPDAATSTRIAELEAALARAGARANNERAAREQQIARAPKSARALLSSWLDEIGAGLGWGVVYFSLLPAWWQGQTLGKKLLRLRIVELAGQPITVMRSLKRYGGYAAGLATGGIGLAQLLWDPNRQALHDKAAHTVVLDERPLRSPPSATTDPRPDT